MGVVEGVVAGAQVAAATEGVLGEPSPYLVVHAALVGLEREQVLGPARPDVLGDLAPAAECIETDQASLDV